VLDEGFFEGLFLRGLSGVVDHALEIDHDDWFVSNDPRIMSCRHQRYFSGSDILLGTVIHHDVEDAGYVILKVGSLAALCFRYRFHVFGPFPSGFELGSAYSCSAYLYKVDLAFLELADLVWRIEMFNFHLG